MDLLHIHNFSYAAKLVLAFVIVNWSVSAHCDRIAPENAANAPEFTQTDTNDWLNSKPLTLESLRGKTVLIDFWTFGCWNCYRSFP